MWSCGCCRVRVYDFRTLFFLKFRVQSFGFEGLRAKGLQCGRFPNFRFSSLFKKLAVLFCSDPYILLGLVAGQKTC